jgi:hypothetical protein
MKIYIAGKVTGLIHADAVSKFARSETALIDAGISPTDIVNPMKLGIPEGINWIDAMHICIKQLRECTAIYVQKDWRDSFGARREVTIAEELKLDIFYESRNDIEMLKNLINTGV